ncbi:MAG: hybrid sensor histidine kinase/response regulator [Chloroflexi bacterium]|nr:hybrid sensor histidine kinase/response regulator [Chloroflexota bacterium]
MSILVVDDLPDFRQLMQAVLEDAGYSDVITAGSTQEAFTILGLDDPSLPTPGVDLILLDINMPETDGVEACQRIKSVSKLRDIPVIMVTGVAAEEKLEQAFSAGATDYILKPTNPAEMIARIGSALELKQEMERRRSGYVSDLEEKNRELELAFMELEKKNEELEEASRAKTQILSTATHELKTPLTSIIGYIDIILMRQNKVGPLNEKQQRYLQTAQRNSYRLKSLVDDLLDISRIESGGLELTPAELELWPEIEEIVTGMQTQLNDKNIDLVLDIPQDICPVLADKLRLGQVISNLLSNACKYSPQGARVTIRAREEDAGVRIDVSDTGIGISPEDQERLFTKFFRADNSSTREVSGSGLGLYITKHLIEAHGGRIWASSQIGQGTTFSINWPKAGQDAAVQAAQRPARPVSQV